MTIHMGFVTTKTQWPCILNEGSESKNQSCWLWVWQSQSLVQIVDWHERFPRMLQGSQSNVQLLLGHYSHSVGCFHEAALHFLEGAKVTYLPSPHCPISFTREIAGVTSQLQCCLSCKPAVEEMTFPQL